MERGCECINMTSQKLIENNMSLVYYVIRKYYPTYINDEDIKQTGMVGLCNAANSWDEEKSTFSTYAIQCIMNQIKYYFRSQKRHQGVLSLNWEYDEADGKVELQDILVGDEDVGYVDLQSIYEHLDDFEIEVINYRKFGLKTAEIANKMGCSQSKISKTLRNIVRKWKENSWG